MCPLDRLHYNDFSYKRKLRHFMSTYLMAAVQLEGLGGLSDQVKQVEREYFLQQIEVRLRRQ